LSVTRGRAVVLSTGEELQTDVLVVAIGAAPEIGWLTIVAAGDVARWLHPAVRA